MFAVPLLPICRRKCITCRSLLLVSFVLNRSFCSVYMSFFTCLLDLRCLLVCANVSHTGLFSGSLLAEMGLFAVYVGLFCRSLLTCMAYLCCLFVGENVIRICLFYGSVLVCTGLFCGSVLVYKVCVWCI